jgi:lysozyme family protein
MYKKNKIIGMVAMTALVASVVVPAFANAATLNRELQFGMSGSDVTSLQTFLAATPTIYPEGRVTGYFGSLTQAAVRNFQARNGIATVGRVGPITLAALNSQMNGGMGNGLDQNAPVISAVNVSTSNTGATLSWSTNENAAALVYYSTAQITLNEASAQTGATISGTSVVAHVNLQTSHTASISGLQPGTTYNYVVYVRDGSGNETISMPSTFRTN